MLHNGAKEGECRVQAYTRGSEKALDAKFLDTKIMAAGLNRRISQNGNQKIALRARSCGQNHAWSLCTAKHQWVYILTVAVPAT